jgi:hypothetical protein
MIKKIRSRAIAFAAAAFLVLAPATTLRAAIPSAENLLPADTLFFLTAPDCAAFRASLHQTPQWLFWKDPAMKPFRNKFMAKWNENFVVPLQRDLGVKFGNFVDLPEGQFTLAITRNGWNGHDDPTPGLLLLLDARGKSDLLQTNLAALRKKWTDSGRPIQTKTIRGISFSVVTLGSNDVPATIAKFFPRRKPLQELGKTNKPSPPAQLVVGQYESLLIVGNSTEAVEPVATRLTGGALPPLSDNALFTADQAAQFHGAPLYYGWFNAKTFFDVLEQAPPFQPNPDAPSPMPRIPWHGILDASGLDGLKSAAFACRQSHDGSQFDLSFTVPESVRQGLFKMFALAPEDANPPPFVPASAMKFWRWRVDGQKFWAALQQMLGNISPNALASLNSLLNIANATAQQKDPDFDVRKNLIANLGNDLISYQKAPVGKTPADLNSPPTIFLFAAAKPDEAVLAVKNVLSLIASQENAPKPRQFLGRTIYSIVLPSHAAPIGTNAPPQRLLYCATGNGYVALTSDISMLEGFLRGNENHAKPLRETAGLADAAQRVGGAGHGLFGYQNQRELMRALFTVLKNEPAADSSSDQLNALADLPFFPPRASIRQWMDFSLLPDYDAVSKYFYFSVYGGSVTPQGFSFKFFAPRPPQLN